MTHDFLKTLMKHYRTYIFDRWGILPAELPGDAAHFAHLAWMCEQVEGWDEERKEKGFRWLGFVQGVFCVRGVFTLTELRDHSRPDETHRDPKWTRTPGDMTLNKLDSAELGQRFLSAPELGGEGGVSGG